MTSTYSQELEISDTILPNDVLCFIQRLHFNHLALGYFIPDIILFNFENIITGEHT